MRATLHSEFIMKKPRKNPSLKLRHKLFDEVRGTCPNPECKTKSGVSTLEIHHIDHEPSNTEEHNLIALCSTCHTLAGKYLIPEAVIIGWKLSLVNRVHPRLGDETAADLAKPMKVIGAKRNIFNATGHTVHQAESMTFKYQTPKQPKRMPAPDSIAAHAAECGYIKELRKQYIRCRMLEGQYDPKRAQHPTALQNAFKKAVGFDPLDAPIENFDTVWRKAHAAVCQTLGARKYQNGFRPHDWEEHKRRMASIT